MTQEPTELERLISRYLDDEATREQRRRLRQIERSDPAAAARVDEYASLDREVGRALRQAMGRSHAFPRTRSPGLRLVLGPAIAAAACLAMMLWLGAPRLSQSGSTDKTRQAGSWFSRPAAASPSAETDQPFMQSFERPRLRVRDTNSDWILVPGARPGEFMIIEVNRVRTRAIAIQNDF
jgi:ferric-dicitrate binding protein FerR (iron transport regulator)